MKILPAVPPDKGDYKPHSRSISSLKLSRHIISRLLRCGSLMPLLTTFSKKTIRPCLQNYSLALTLPAGTMKTSRNACHASKRCLANTSPPG